MADISTIVGVDGSSYTIKDATARGLLNGHSVNKDVPANAAFTDTTYESKQAASGGTDLSLVTTGEKYNWNNASGSGIEISDTQPTDANNKLWVKETPSSEGVSIPTMADIEVIENTLNSVEDSIAYVQSGDTASRAYTAEEYVYLKNHPSLAEGLYTVNSEGIPIETSVTGHLTANSRGGLNGLMSQHQAKSAKIESASAASHTFNIPSNTRHFFIASAASTDRDWAGFISASSNGTVTFIEMAKGSDVTQVQAGTNSITIGLGHNAGLQCLDFYIVGSKMT